MKSTMQDSQLTLPHLFARAEKLHSNKEVVSVAEGVKKVQSYGSWADRTRRAAAGLDDLGISADAAVGCLAWNTSQHLELQFAAACSGRVWHSINPRMSPEQIKFVVNHAGDEVVFVDASLLSVIRSLLPSLRNLRELVVIGDAPEEHVMGSRISYEQLLERSDPAEFHVNDEYRPASICYTGGTTGNPKGVAYSHRALFLHTLALMAVDNIGIREADVVLPLVPMSHANAWGLTQAAVACGAKLVMPGRDLSGQVVAKLIEDERVTVSTGVPTVWTRVLPELLGRDASSVRMLCSGGSAVPQRLVDMSIEVTGHPLVQVWGMTETSAFASLALPRSGAPIDDPASRKAISQTQGYAVLGIELRIRDEADQTELPWDGRSVGELQCRGPWVTGSYFEDARSSDSFTADGWLKTGDLAKMDRDGYVTLVDRARDLIKSGGEWISSVEVEDVILTYPGVESVAVVSVSSDEWGERPIAYVVPESDIKVHEDDLLSYLGQHLPKFWVPDAVVLLEEMPITAVGKISKRDLRGMIQHERSR